VIAGAAVAFVAYLLGVIIEGWSITLSAGTVLVGSAVALGLTFMGATAPAILGLKASSVVRLAAALVGAFALIDLGDMISDFDGWSAVSIALTALYIVGAAVLAYGAWATSGGSLLADAQGPLRAMKMDMIDRFIYLGALGAIVTWFLLMAIVDIYNFNALGMLVVFLATLVLAVRWLERSPAAGKLPLPAPWTIVALAGATAVIGLWWFVGIIGRTISEGLADAVAWVVLILYLASLASLAVGAFLSIGGVRATQPAA
jgi:hypothetical protein